MAAVHGAKITCQTVAGCPLYLVLNQCSHGIHMKSMLFGRTHNEGNRNLAPPGVRIQAHVPCVIVFELMQRHKLNLMENKLICVYQK